MIEENYFYINFISQKLLLLQCYCVLTSSQMMQSEYVTKKTYIIKDEFNFILKNA